jgi:hypothetical protein
MSSVRQEHPCGFIRLDVLESGCVESLANAAYAGPTTNSGCAVDKVSCRKPGNVSSSVRMQPSIRSSRSRIRTLRPLRASSAPHTREFMPLPTMTASTEEDFLLDMDMHVESERY